MRLYRTNCALSSDDGLCVEMRISGGGHVAVAVGRDVAEAQDDLQREWWRIERLEARHTLSLDAMLPRCWRTLRRTLRRCWRGDTNRRRWLARSQHSPQFR